LGPVAAHSVWYKSAALKPPKVGLTSFGQHLIDRTKFHNIRWANAISDRRSDYQCANTLSASDLFRNKGHANPGLRSPFVAITEQQSIASPDINLVHEG
jgi:hypothetical protein